MERLPRRFTPAGLRAKAREDVPLVRVLDTFVVGTRHRKDSEWLVGIDALGEVIAMSLEEAELMSGACKDLAHHDAVSEGPPRRLDFEAIYIMTVETVEHVESESSHDDAVYLYGKIRGPIPGAGSGMGADGMLAVSRAEVLQAVAWARARCFHSAPTEGRAARCSQLALPGEGSRALARGEGLVLAYPLFPPEVSFDDPSNDLLVSHIAYDTLRSLQGELASSGSEAWLVEEPLPVPNRNQLIRELQGQGFEVDENHAVKRRDAAGLTGWLGNVFGVGVTKVDIPPEAALDTYFDLAARALELVVDWPSEALQSIAARTGVGNAPRESPPVPTTRAVDVVRAPAKPSPAWTDAFVRGHREAGAASQVMSNATLAAERATWSHDFDAQHAAAKSPAAARRRLRVPPAKGRRGPEDEPWRDDFDGTTTDKTAADTTSPGEDWSDDFG